MYMVHNSHCTKEYRENLSSSSSQEFSTRKTITVNTFLCVFPEIETSFLIYLVETSYLDPYVDDNFNSIWFES